MSFNKDLDEIENLLEKARKRYVVETTENLMEEIKKNNQTLREGKKEVEDLQELTDEENNAFVQHLLQEGKRRNEVKLAKPIIIKQEENNL